MDARVQTPRPDDPAEASIGDLFHQLVDDGRSFVGAEANVYKKIAAYRLGKAKYGIAALGASWVLLNASLIAFFVSIVIALSTLIGPLGAGLAVLVGTGILAFFLVRYGLGKLAALGGDAEEKEALRAGEQRA